jgi:NAD(P)-dependent dehydrogenase (short-subunit alcohol dehydrogenase family)
MGEQLARTLVDKGWRVACVDLNVKGGQKLADELGESAMFIRTDVASYDSQAETFDKVFKTWGRIDALLANAGIPDRSSVYILSHRGKDEYSAQLSRVKLSG